MDLLSQLTNLLSQRQPQMPPQQGVARGEVQGSYQRRPGGAQINGGTLQNGQNFQEDQFSFPNGGQFRRQPNGNVYLEGAYVPDSLGLQEDNFTFPQTQMNPLGQAGNQISGLLSQLQNIGRRR